MILPERVCASVRAGIAGVVGPDATRDRLNDAVRLVLDGGRYIDPTLATALVDPPEKGLSPRELQVVEQLMSGNQNKVIAADLQISEETVKSHISSLMRKLDAYSGTEIVVKALQRSFIRLPAAA